MTSLTSIVNARRLDRVLPWIGAAVLAAGVATFLVVYFGRSDSSSAPTTSNQQVAVKPAPTVPVPRDARHVAIAFLSTAVSRKQLARSYDLATPTLRQGLSRREWVKGNIPVPYYPTTAWSISNAKYETDYSHPRDIQLEISVGPPKGVTMKSTNFLVGLVKRHGRWLVDYWGVRGGVAIPAPT